MTGTDAVKRFDRRADSYDRGRLGDWHRLVAERTADLALTERQLPRKILDVGCGTGMLLARLAVHLPDAELLAGVDPSPRMVASRLLELAGLAPLSWLPLVQAVVATA